MYILRSPRSLITQKPLVEEKTYENKYYLSRRFTSNLLIFFTFPQLRKLTSSKLLLYFQNLTCFGTCNSYESCLATKVPGLQDCLPRFFIQSQFLFEDVVHSSLELGDPNSGFSLAPNVYCPSSESLLAPNRCCSSGSTQVSEHSIAKGCLAPKVPGLQDCLPRFLDYFPPGTLQPYPPSDR